MKRLQIFRPGKHTASSGKVIEFTEAVLKAAAAAYDPKLHEAPITIGHPEDNAPAYGWLSKLHFSEATGLEADPIQVDAAFAEMVEAGRFKKMSASFYEPDCATNPKPGVYYVRHVAFLGAQPPAVKGLRNVEFAENEKGVIEFSDWDGINAAQMMRGLRDWILGKFGQEEADKALPNWPIDNALITAAQAPAKTIAYAEPTVEKTTVTAEELKQQKADLDARELKIKTQESAARRKAHVEFAESLVKAGKLLPVHQEGLVAFMSALPESGVIEFGEGDKKQTPAAAKWLQDFLTAQPKVVEFSERGAGDGTGDQAEPDPTQIAAKAVEFVESERVAGRTVSIAAAVAHVSPKADA